MSKSYRLYCDYCNYSQVLSKKSDTENLVVVKQSSVPRGAPKIDPLTKKIVIPPTINRIRTFKCPSCGFAVKVKEIKDEQANRNNGSQIGFTGQEIPRESAD